MIRALFQQKQVVRLFSTNVTSSTAKKLRLSNLEQDTLDENCRTSKLMFETMDREQQRSVRNYLLLKRIQVLSMRPFLSVESMPMNQFGNGLLFATCNGLVLPVMVDAKSYAIAFLWFCATNGYCMVDFINGNTDYNEKNKLHKKQFDDDIEILEKMLAEENSKEKIK